MTVTIGIPCYNEARFIKRTIKAALAAQDVDKILICDNASDDGTSEICQRYANANPKIHYIRHQTNIGMMPNIRYIAEHVNTPYFCFFGAHDIIPENYVSELKKLLEAHPEAVMAFGPAQWLDKQDQPTELYEYNYRDKLRNKDVIERVYDFLVNIWDCTLYNGLWRTKDFHECSCYEAYIGPDVITMARALTRGTFVYSPHTYYGRRMVRDETWEDHLVRYKEVLDSQQKELLGHWADICLQLLKDLPGVCPLKKIYYVHKFKKHLGCTFGHKIKHLVKKCLPKSVAQRLKKKQVNK